MSEKRESHVNELLKQLCSQQLSGVSAGSFLIISLLGVFAPVSGSIIFD